MQTVTLIVVIALLIAVAIMFTKFSDINLSITERIDESENETIKYIERLESIINSHYEQASAESEEDFKKVKDGIIAINETLKQYDEVLGEQRNQMKKFKEEQLLANARNIAREQNLRAAYAHIMVRRANGDSISRISKDMDGFTKDDLIRIKQIGDTEGWPYPGKPAPKTEESAPAHAAEPANEEHPKESYESPKVRTEFIAPEYQEK